MSRCAGGGLNKCQAAAADASRLGLIQALVTLNAAPSINPCPAGVGWPNSPAYAAPESTTSTESSDGGRRCVERNFRVDATTFGFEKAISSS